MKRWSLTACSRRDEAGPAIVLVLLCGLAAAAVAQVDTTWVRRYDGNAHDFDYIAASAVDRWGNFYVTGYATDTAGGKDFLTIKYRPNGDTAWTRTYNGPGNELDIARSVAVDNSGNVFVAGISHGSTSGFDYATLKYDSLGGQLWLARYSAPGDTDDRAQVLVLGPDGGCYVTGSTINPGSGSDYLTVRYGPGGDTVWTRVYDGGSNGEDETYSMVVDSAGNAFVAGTDYGANSVGTLKYGPSGDLVWSDRRAGWANAIALGSSGRVYVSGVRNLPAGGEDFLTIAYDASSGDSAWVATFDGPAHDADDATALAVGASGRIYVTGFSTRDTVGWNQDFLTICYLPTGETAWVRRFPGPYSGGGDYAEAIVLDSAERLYVCGYGRDSANNSTLMAVSYDPDGDLLWLSRYLSPSGGGGEWTTANTFGGTAVYFAGYSYGDSTWTDCTVAKYDPPVGIAGPGQTVGREFAPGATIVRGTLVLQSAPGGARAARRVLVDISGRTVARLAPGANDVSRLAPGVYFVRQTTEAGTSTGKVVLE